MARLESGWSRFPVGESTALAYKARPAATGEPLPAVVLVQEIWGVDEFITDVAGRFAAAGYLAFAPDLYSLGGARPPELAAERIQRAKEFLDTLPPRSGGTRPRGMRRWRICRATRAGGCGRRSRRCSARTSATATWRSRAPRSRRLARTRPRTERPASWAGARAAPWPAGSLAWSPAWRRRSSSTAPPRRAEEVPGIACPVLGFYGGADPVVTGGVPAFAAAMEATGKQFTWHIYDGAPHAFFNDTRASYTVAAARHAWAETLAFLSRNLGGTPPSEQGEVG